MTLCIPEAPCRHLHYVCALLGDYSQVLFLNTFRFFFKVFFKLLGILMIDPFNSHSWGSSRQFLLVNFSMGLYVLVVRFWFDLLYYLFFVMRSQYLGYFGYFWVWCGQRRLELTRVCTGWSHMDKEARVLCKMCTLVQCWTGRLGEGRGDVSSRKDSWKGR